MYRLLKLRKLSSCKSQGVSFPVSSHIFTRTCALCNHNFVLKAPKDALTFSFVSSMRMQTTHTKTIVQAISKKKKKKPKKKFAELLEVTEDSSSQKKASVSKLTSKHLSLLAEQPEIDLNELFQLKKRKNHSYDNFELKNKQDSPEVVSEYVNTISLKSNISKSSLRQNSSKETSNQKSSLVERENAMENVYGDSVGSCVSCESVETFSNVDPMISIHSMSEDIAKELSIDIDDPELQKKLIEDLNISSDQCVSLDKQTVFADQLEFHEVEVDNLEVPVELEKKRKGNNRGTKTTDTFAKERAIKRKEMEQLGRSDSLTRGVTSYMDICVSAGLLNKAISTLDFYRSRKSMHQSKLLRIKPYNILLQAYAGQGNLKKVKDVLRMIEEDKFNWSLETYAALFECIGRLPETPTNKSLLQEWVCSLETAGWTPNDVMVKNIFLGDQRETVLKALHVVLPCFEPDYPLGDLCYSCELLRKLQKSNKDELYTSPVKSVMSRTDLLAAAKEQLAIEKKDSIEVKSIETREESSTDTSFYREKLSEVEANWREVLFNAFQRELEVLKAQQKGYYGNENVLHLYPYLVALEPSVYVDLLMKEIRQLAEGSETYSPLTTVLHRQLGSKVQMRYEVEYKRRFGVLDKVESIYEKYCDWFTNPTSIACNTREQWQMLLQTNSSGPSADIEKKQWPNLVVVALGRFLYNLLLRDVKIDVNIMKSNNANQHLLPAFYMLFRNHGRLLKEEIKPHPALARLFRSAALDALSFDINLVPMLSPPIPWTTASSGVGGYLMTQADLVRLPYLAYQQKLRMEEVSPNRLYPSLDALNQLGSVPWVVNEPVLDVAIEVFNQGGSPRLDIPQPPSACRQPTPVTPDMSREDRIKAFQERIMLRRRRGEMYSLWCDTLYRLSLANHYRKRIFWLPHNMDFRGRVYPCPPHLNHLGADMPRSLLKFAQGQPLGPSGLDWLMIHLINLTGLMKREPLEQRLAFAKSVLPDILDSADYPLHGEMWWARNDEPWQVLATCMEIAQALRSGDPEKYVSNFPVHQDGSCNGLQHYAALGRDALGAESVNLTPASRPQDVYTCVATVVETARARDAADGMKVAQVLEGFVRRKVIKQTVMTTVYGVTRYGARLQIARQLKDIEDFPKEFVWHGSSYLVHKTFDSLREMFTSTKKIQDWFTECARQIAHSCGENVEWITPLGLPVVQPYIRTNNQLGSQNKLQKLKEHFVMDMYERPNIVKQKNAFPPNFIHSLDSCHMMLTSLFCEREGITFVSVHDCFWTHPCTVDKMNKICREQFVSLHSQPILQDLSKFLCIKYGAANRFSGDPDHMIKLFKRVPKTEDFDLRNVLDSVYFFS